MRLMHFLEQIRASYWFVPALLAVSAVILSVITLALDRAGSGSALVRFHFVWQNEPESARWLHRLAFGGVGPLGRQDLPATVSLR